MSLIVNIFEVVADNLNTKSNAKFSLACSFRIKVVFFFQPIIRAYFTITQHLAHTLINLSQI